MWVNTLEMVKCGCTSFPVLTHPLTSKSKPRPIILNKIIRVLGSSTCSLVARSLLSFWFAEAEGPFLFTPTPRSYDISRFRNLEEYFDKAWSWFSVLSFDWLELGIPSFGAEGFVGLGRLTAGRAATLELFETADRTPWATPVRTATCCLRRLYCFVKSILVHSF